MYHDRIVYEHIYFVVVECPIRLINSVQYSGQTIPLLCLLYVSIDYDNDNNDYMIIPPLLKDHFDVHLLLSIKMKNNDKFNLIVKDKKMMMMNRQTKRKKNGKNCFRTKQNKTKQNQSINYHLQKYPIVSLYDDNQSSRMKNLNSSYVNYYYT